MSYAWYEHLLAWYEHLVPAGGGEHRALVGQNVSDHNISASWNMEHVYGMSHVAAGVRAEPRAAGAESHPYPYFYVCEM
jgi:hypothetical protein